MCDINCCCDPDCTDVERNLFNNCSDEECNKSNVQRKFFCNQYPTCRDRRPTSTLEDFFCIVKGSLPDNRVKNHHEVYTAAFNYLIYLNN